MRHFKKKFKLNKTYSHKKLMISNLSNSLIKYEFLRTTLVKSKILRSFIEPLITISKNFSNFNVKFIFSKLRNVDSVLKLFKIISPRYIDRKGGYLRIFKSGHRIGDNSKLSIIKFI